MLRKVICIDDDPITLMLCKKVMERVEFASEINTLQNGEEAIKQFEDYEKIDTKNAPDMVFIDLNMPVMNGWEFLDEYFKREYHKKFKTHFIVLSSTIDPKDVEKSKLYSMVVDFLSKPITKTMLEELKSKY
ncbi:MAG: response regulator [Flavobacterium sp.]|jgi:CheY-like chemotaxis protein|uniref:response regulator n=1 Tax=Flavobacterium TaxID=237 RepID=UPI000DB401F1|nr:response regulator [Flavobacterium sp.]MCZ8330719.1 response regulator [Flavobacterium sp.]PZO28648.1 MAG: response regulator [Flavobacteriaceae bacterium]